MNGKPTSTPSNSGLRSTLDFQYKFHKNQIKIGQKFALGMVSDGIVSYEIVSDEVVSDEVVEWDNARKTHPSLRF